MLTWVIDLRTTLLPPRDQGSRPTCLSWAVTAAHEFGLPDGRLSVEYLHWNSGNYAGGRGTVLAAAGALRSEGQPDELQWPYLEHNDDADPGYLPPSTVVGPFSAAVLRLSQIDVDVLSTELSSGYLPVIALRVTDAFVAAAGGVIRPDGSGSDGHAVVAVGIARFAGAHGLGGVMPGERLVCVRNSWGRGWGVDGYALITETALHECAFGALVVDSV
jgi:hypothetical protein